ncbi:FAD-dependent monooxygenase [Xenophilus sp.]|uniref:FAD-dependent monooxygenase n=1 Tax=Xenophilus sp. TaxID=1873499 RepID=UPI0037DC3CB8
MTTPHEKPPVIIVGGGIGGVATALALGRLGLPVQLLEQADQIGAIGYGVQIGPNVMPMLERLGVGEAARQAAYLPEEILLYEMDSGRKLVDIPLRTPQFHARYQGAPYVAIHRVDFHELLLQACRAYPNIDLNQSTQVVGYEHTAGGCGVATADGRFIEGAAVIAADGLRSRLRLQLHPGDSPRDTGYLAHRTIVPMAQAPASIRERRGVTMWTGPGFHVIYYPLRGRSEMNIVVVVRVPPDLDVTDNERYLEHIAALTRRAAPEARDVVQLVNLERRWSIADREPVRRWADGCFTLMGDAAHATLQSLAQGAGMAVEDAVTLAELVQSCGHDFTAAFKRFERARFLRAARVQLESRDLWDIYHCDGARAEVRSQQFEEKSADDFYRCLDWLWQAPPIRT